MAEKNLNAVLRGIRDAARDALTLDVVTMTGTITVEPVKHEEDGKVDIGKLAKSLMEAPVLPNSDIKVLALTHLKIDLDCIQFVKEGLSDSEKPLLEAHNAMVKTATEARNSLMLAIKEIVGLG